MTSFKILLYNLEYGRGHTGSWRNYIIHWFRFLRKPRKKEDIILQKVHEMIAQEDPDLCCFIEIDKESPFHKNGNQLNRLADEKRKEYHFSKKYSKKGILQHLPYFRAHGNGFLAKKKHPFKEHYFKHGRKKHFYEIKINKDITLFMAHFPLRKKTRRQDFEELKKLIEKKKKVIICGDFNIFKGFKELDPLVKRTGLYIVNKLSDKTYPAYNPKKAFDLFICSDTIKVKNLRVLHPHLSDHAPVILEIDI